MLRSLTTVLGSSREPVGLCCTAMSLVAMEQKIRWTQGPANFDYELYFIRQRKRSGPVGQQLDLEGSLLSEELRHLAKLIVARIREAAGRNLQKLFQVFP